MEQSENLGDRIKVILRMKEMSQTDLALKLGVSNNSISLIIKNATCPRYEVIKKFYEVFPDINFNYFFFGQGRPFDAVKRSVSDDNQSPTMIDKLMQVVEEKAKLEQFIEQKSPGLLSEFKRQNH